MITTKNLSLRKYITFYSIVKYLLLGMLNS